MQNPFDALGLERGATAEQIRSAYHGLVKLCHPDRMQDESAQQAAQETLVQLNLAYSEAMRQASFCQEKAVGITDAKQSAKRLFDQGRVESALRMLARVPERDAEWYDLQGCMLMRMGDAEAAHASFRTAVRLNPDNNRYRELALSAAVQMRKQKTLRGRMSGWARSVMSRML